MYDEKKKYTIKEESFLFSCNDKLKNLGYGEWVEEFDRVIFEYMDYECMVHRAYKGDKKTNLFFSGHLCGYVKIEGKDLLQNQSAIKQISCHCGITYNSLFKYNSVYPENWIGFDCAHEGDIIPSIEMIRKTSKNCTYKNVEFCMMQCMNIVNQLIWIEKVECKTIGKVSDRLE